MLLQSITPAQTPQAKREAENLLHQLEAMKLLDALKDYVGHLQGAQIEGTPGAQSNWSAVEFLERLPFVFPSVETEAELDQYRTELGIDDEGYRLNSDGDRMHRWHTPVERSAL
jgi:hypothetical protein